MHRVLVTIIIAILTVNNDQGICHMPRHPENPPTSYVHSCCPLAFQLGIHSPGNHHLFLQGITTLNLLVVTSTLLISSLNQFIVDIICLGKRLKQWKEKCKKEQSSRETCRVVSIKSELCLNELEKL